MHKFFEKGTLMEINSTQPMPAYDDIAEALSQLQAGCHAAESHGMLTAFICAGHRLDSQLWLEAVTGTIDTNTEISQALRQLFITLYTATAHDLSDPALRFQLLLPSDEVGLIQRVEALGSWCQGFVTGLVLAGVNFDELEDTEEIKEILHDLMQIGTVDDEILNHDEEDEVAYTEIVEYVRMAVILIHGELAALLRQDDKPDHSRLH